MNEFDSDSSYSSGGLHGDVYIKKHINPVQRGESAIFGDPISEQRNDIIMPSPTPSQQEEDDQYQENRSKINIDQEIPPKQKEEEEKKQPQKRYEDDEEIVADMLNQIQKPKVEVQRQVKQEQNARNDDQNEPPEVMSRYSEENIDSANRGQQKSQQMQPVDYVPIEEQRKADIQQNNHISNQMIDLKELKQQDQNQIQKYVLRYTQQQQQKLRQKHERANNIQMNGGQLQFILDGLKINTQKIETAYSQILTQNTILAQFKEDASRKLEENIKATLKQKINEINRENSKEIKDIKNFTLTVQQLLQKNEKRMEKMEKGIEEILGLMKSKK